MWKSEKSFVGERHSAKWWQQREEKAEMFDLCKKAAAMKQVNYLPLLETARAVGGENTNEFGQISKMTYSAAPHVPLFCSYHILTSSVIYYWTDARQLGMATIPLTRSQNEPGLEIEILTARITPEEH